MAGNVTLLKDSEELVILGETLRPLLTHEMGSPIEVFDTSGPAEAGPPPHSHPWEEIYVVVAGELDVSIDGEVKRLRAGDAAHVPSGVKHAYRNVTQAHFLTIVSKGNAAQCFRQLAREVPMNPPDFPAVIRVAAAHGIEIAG